MSKHLKPEEVMQRLGVTRNTLQSWRTRGGGPPYIKLGHRTVVYPLQELQAWEDKRKFNNTAEEKQQEEGYPHL